MYDDFYYNDIESASMSDLEEMEERIEKRKIELKKDKKERLLKEQKINMAQYSQAQQTAHYLKEKFNLLGLTVAYDLGDIRYEPSIGLGIRTQKGSLQITFDLTSFENEKNVFDFLEKYDGKCYEIKSNWSIGPEGMKSIKTYLFDASTHEEFIQKLGDNQ